MNKARVFDVTIDDLTTSEVKQHISSRIKDGSAGYITTVNSEFLLMSRGNPSFKTALDQADLRLCDGVGVQWAAAFLQNRTNRIINILRWPSSLIRLLIQPSSARRVLKNRLAGRQLFLDLLAYGAEYGHSVYFLGGGPDVAARVAEEATKRYPKLKVAGYYGGRPEDPCDIIKHLRPSSLLFVAFGPPRQEIFINQNLTNLRANMAIGIGGTFDYFVGAKPIGSTFRQIKPPAWVDRWGIESFWRLFTQPNRFGRVWNSVITFSAKVALSSSSTRSKK